MGVINPARRAQQFGISGSLSHGQWPKPLASRLPTPGIANGSVMSWQHIAGDETSGFPSRTLPCCANRISLNKYWTSPCISAQPRLLSGPHLPVHFAPATVTLNASCSPAACSSSMSPWWMFPRRNSSASGSSRYFSTARRIGRAP